MNKIKEKWNIPKWVWNVPNTLSLVRLALIPVIVITYLKSRQQTEYLYVAIAALVLSGLTDALDGMIARHFNQITDIGKLLDPIADKLTQIAVALCVTIHYPRLLPLLAICLIKETCQAIGGAILLKNGEAVRGARWYGKIATVLFYAVMCAIAVFDTMPDEWRYALVGIVSVAMVFAFINYVRDFVQINRENRRRATPADEDKK